MTESDEPLMPDAIKDACMRIEPAVMLAARYLEVSENPALCCGDVRIDNTCATRCVVADGVAYALYMARSVTGHEWVICSPVFLRVCACSKNLSPSLVWNVQTAS